MIHGHKINRTAHITSMQRLLTVCNGQVEGVNVGPRRPTSFVNLGRRIHDAHRQGTRRHFHMPLTRSRSAALRPIWACSDVEAVAIT